MADRWVVTFRLAREDAGSLLEVEAPLYSALTERGMEPGFDSFLGPLRLSVTVRAADEEAAAAAAEPVVRDQVREVSATLGLPPVTVTMEEVEPYPDRASLAALLGIDEEQYRLEFFAITTSMLVDMLVKGHYDALETWTKGRHLSADALRRAVEAFGEPLIRVRVGDRDSLHLEGVRHADRTTYDASVPLWTGEGESELTLELRFVELDEGGSEREILAIRTVGRGKTHRAPVVRMEPPPPPTPPTERRPPPDYCNPVPERWRPLLRDLVRRLVIGDYAGLARDGFVAYVQGPDDDSIGTWIEDYPWKLVDLPEEAWEYSDHLLLSQADTWYASVDMWTAEEGPSDLTLEATVYDDGTSISIQIDGVHVM